MKAYYNQFQKDFSLFLKCRAQELVDGGRMILTLLGRRSQNPASKECSYIWELLGLALNDLVDQVNTIVSNLIFILMWYHNNRTLK